MGKIISSVLGGGDAPKVSTQPTADTEEAKRRASQSRSALFETEGGAAGVELDPEQVGRRRTLLGN